MSIFAKKIFCKMKYLLYYLIPRKLSYKLLYESISAWFGTLSFTEPHKSDLKTIYVSYSEYKKMTKNDKLCYLDSYIKNNKVLSYMNNNMISIISIIATFIFGVISIL